MSAVAQPQASRAGRPFGARFYPLLLCGALLLTALLFLVHISIGTVNVTPDQMIAILTGQPTDQLATTVVHDLRLPRAMIAVAAGASLALAGAILQSITGNPLAEPDLTGATSGGVLFAVLWLSRQQSFGWDFAPGGLELPLVALFGGLLSGGLVYLLSRRRAGSSLRFVLTGVLVASILRSCTSIILLRNQNAIGSIFLWMVGSLNGRTWTEWGLLWPWALLAIPLGLLCAGAANVLQLGDAAAAGLGMRVERTRALLLFVAILLTAGAVAVVGALGFLGLIAPHLARRLVGQDARRLYPLSAVFGAALLLTADLISRGIVEIISLPVGAVMALLGAPFLMFLLRRQVMRNA